MPCGLCGSLNHNRSACPWARSTQPAMNNDDTYHDELTAHLAAQEHPQPHPKRYDHGYTVQDMRLRDFGLQRPAPAARKHPGPITMHEPRVDWIGWVLAGGTLLAGVFAAVAWVKGVRP